MLFKVLVSELLVLTMLPETASKLGIRFEPFIGECIELELGAAWSNC